MPMMLVFCLIYLLAGAAFALAVSAALQNQRFVKERRFFTKSRWRLLFLWSITTLLWPTFFIAVACGGLKEDDDDEGETTG